MRIFTNIQRLLSFGLKENMFHPTDLIYVRNRILSKLKIDEWMEPGEEFVAATEPHEVLEDILDWAYENQVIKNNTITERDLLDAEIMDCLMPRPSELIASFRSWYKNSPEEATSRFYQLSKSSNYIRMDRIRKNIQWEYESKFGVMDITINLSKPEKDPKEIALMKDLPKSQYPLCLLCKENEGYHGTLGHPARSQHRILPIRMNEEDWFLQYSPYVYYNEHSILFRAEHLPMKMTNDTFKRLLDFVEQYPHYFIGSNADLPIVGGSILSHDHFQGGKYTFALERAEVEHTFTLGRFPNVEISMVKWPMSVLRLNGEKEQVLQAASVIFAFWKNYSDESVEILSHTGDTPHNTVTPIARKRNGQFELDLVLRNNRTSESHPDGIFHPHQDLHHIKKENIGLIEVMGLAVLPGRLTEEMDKLADYWVEGTEIEMWAPDMLKHYDWYVQLKQEYATSVKNEIVSILKTEIGRKFENVLEDSGVFKCTEEGREAFHRFIGQLKENI